VGYPQPAPAHPMSDRKHLERGQATFTTSEQLPTGRHLCDTERVVNRWFEITVDAPREWAEAVANFLIDHDAPGLRSEEYGERSVFVAHFASAPPLEALRRFSADLGGGAAGAGAVAIHMRTIADEDWAENWKLHFQPQLVGNRLYVCPSWNATPPSGCVAVVIDPGMAFGTGQHATTRGCLQLLEQATRERQMTRALDVGTGSGVLAIALAKLGVPEVWAIDNDPSARPIAAVNAARNQVGASVRIAASVVDVPGTFDIVVANLFAKLLQELAPQLTQFLVPGGLLLCSGLLDTDEHMIRTTFESVGFQVDQRCEENGWVTLGLRRKAGW
jgi:ribosomal protein L11 methyltransferase